MIIDNEGVALHVVEDGNPDGATVLLLHGITSCTDTWNWLVPHLVADYRVLRLDFRGHGQSGRAESHCSFPAYVSDAIAVCEQVAGGPSIVIGHSLGGHLIHDSLSFRATELATIQEFLAAHAS